MIQSDFNIVFFFFFFGGERGVFVVVISTFKSFILKLDIVTSIFLNIFVQDCMFQRQKMEIRFLFFGEKSDLTIITAYF